MSPPQKLEVDPKVYYQSATNCFDAAEALADTFLYIFNELREYGQMAGRDEDGRAWATSYDESVTQAVVLYEDVHRALRAYGTALNDIGYEHAKSDATVRGTAQPERPADPATTAPDKIPELPASAAGGTPQGLAQTAIDVLDAINCPLPDGDTDKLADAADAWDRLGRLYPNTNAKDKITISVTLFDGVSSADATQVREDLKTIENAIAELLNACNQLSKSCTDYKEAIEELREEIQGYVESIIAEAALNLTVTIVASCLTGVGGIIAGAKAVESARRWSKKIQDAVTAWRRRKAAQLGGLIRDAMAAAERAWKALCDLINRLLNRGKKPTTTTTLTDADRRALTQGPSDRRGNSLTEILRSDETPTPEQQRQIDELNEALAKLPAHQGPVTRHTEMTPEQLAQYEPGKNVTEVGFTSTSTNPKGSNELLVNSSNVEFQIVSRSGRNYSEYGTPDEVLFPSGTEFHVESKTMDPASGKTIIVMFET